MTQTTIKPQLKVREWTLEDIPFIVDYFVNAKPEYLLGMGASKDRLPPRSGWIRMLQDEFYKDFPDKDYHYIIWEIDGVRSGHSNVNFINYGRTANMHLHLWIPGKRRSGMGLQLLDQTVPCFFDLFRLETLVCEPYAKNPAPNHTLLKFGFEFIKTHEITPGMINFQQHVNRYELTRTAFEKIRKQAHIK